MRNLDEMVALITGGTRGIGREMVHRVAEAGARVYTCGRTERALEQLRDETDSLAGEVTVTRTDVADGRKVASLADQIRREEGRLDALVNNAGVLGARQPLESVAIDSFRHTIDVNLNGAFITSKLSIPLLRASDDAVIVNVSSSVGRTGRGRWGPYAISKHGLEGMTDTLADELESDGIPVVSANPGGTATEMRAEAYPDEDPSTLPRPDEVAETLVLLTRTLETDQTGNRYNCRDLFEYLDPGQTPSPDRLPTAEA